MRATSIANRLVNRVYLSRRASVVACNRTPMSIMSDLLLDGTRKLVYFEITVSFDLPVKLTMKSTWFSHFRADLPPMCDTADFHIG
jgi:hypothetical protein